VGFGLTGYVPFVVYIGLVVALLAVIFHDVRYGIYGMVPILPYRSIYESVQAYPLGKDLVDLIILGMLIGWFMRKKEPLEWTNAYIPVAVLFIVTFAGVLNGMSNVPTSSSFFADGRLRDWKNYIVMTILFVVILNNIRNVGDIRKVILILLLVVTAQALQWTRNNRFRSHEHFSYDVRDAGTFVYLGPNHLASFFVEYMLLALGIFWSVKKDRLLKYLCGFCFFISLYPVLFLYSRGAYAGLAIGLLMFAIFRARILIPVVLVPLIFWQTVLPTPVVERISMAMAGGSEFENVGNREYIWNRGKEVFRDNFVFGIGYRTFQYMTGEGELKDTHNMYLSVAAEMGVVGLAVFIVILLYAARSGLLLYLRAVDPLLKSLGMGFFVSTISVAVMNLFGDRWSYIMMQGFYWVFWALVERGLIISRDVIQTKKFAEVA
jgi:putative inorganic carbon (HCO3(-)) transporter